MHLIDIPHSSRLFKALIQGGHFEQATKQVVPCSAWSASAFVSRFLKAAGKDNIVRMAKGNGAFVVVELVQRVNEEGSAEEKKTLKEWFGPSVLAEIEAGNGKGSSVLLERLRSL